MVITLDADRVLRDVESARAAAHSGDAVKAARLYRRLLRRLDGAEAAGKDLLAPRVRAALGLALTEWETSGDLASSLQLIASIEAELETLDTPQLVVVVRGQRGLLLLRSGDVEGSLQALDQAAQLLEEAETFDQMSILLNRSTLYMERGLLGPATEDLMRCAAIAEQSENWMLAFKAKHNLGYVEFLAGRIPRALATLESAEALNPGDPHPISLLDRARVLREAGLTADADHLLGRAASLLRQGRQFQDLAETEMVRAECALAEGEASRARALAASAVRRFVRRKNLTWQRKAELLMLQCDRRVADQKVGAPRSAALRGLAVRAEDLAVWCRDEGRSDIERSAALLAAECRLRVGQFTGWSPPPIRSTDPLQSRLQTREVRALSAMNAGDHRRASEEVHRGLAELGSYQNRFGSLDLRTASAVHGVALAKLQLDLAMQTGRPAVVFAGVERARAVSTRLAQVRPPSDERTAELLAELRQVEEEARGLTGDVAAAESLARLRIRSAHLQRDIRARAWELEADLEGPVHASARLAAVRAAAGDSAFATYARHHGRWIAVVSAGRRVELYDDLASVADVDELVRRVRADLDAIAMPRLPDPIVAAIRGSIDTTLRKLDDLLVKPLRIDGRPLIVSCSGSLVVMPWSLLPSRTGLSMVVTPSATGWLRSQEKGRVVQPRVVAISGPELNRSADEARAAGEAWPAAMVLTGAEATVAALKGAVEQADVVHVAAHGTHRQDSPLFSSIRLDDGQLYAYELDAESHIAPFVALSACDAGLATVRPGDEGLGLTNALLQLGTQSVIAGVAHVRDDLAADVMRRVHHGMANGLDSAAALAAAQVDCGDAGVPVPFLSFGSTW